MRIRRIVDLSVVVDAETQVYPGDPRPTLEDATTIESHGYNLLSLRLGSQTGTHVDSPYHFSPSGPGLEDCDLSLFVGPALVIDVRSHGARERITWEAVEPHLATLGERRIVALHTGWSDRHLGSDRYFDHPFLDAGACRRMLDLGVRTFLVDYINIDETVLDDEAHQDQCCSGTVRCACVAAGVSG